MLKKGGNLKRASTAPISSWFLAAGELHQYACRFDERMHMESGSKQAFNIDVAMAQERCLYLAAC
jgi:hypothetical protein